MAKKKKKSNKTASKPLSDKRFVTEKARSLPIYKCYYTADWEQYGMTDVIVARERGNGNLCVGVYLCDTWCLGVKDALGRPNLSKEDFKREIVDHFPNIRECDYVYAHNLIYGAEAFAAEVGIEPHPDFALWSKILEEDTDDVPLIEMEFGHNGKYFLVTREGSRESRYINTLKNKLGDDFDYTIGFHLGDFDDDDFDVDDFDDDDFDVDDFDDDDLADDRDEYQRFQEIYAQLKELMGENAPKSFEEMMERAKEGMERIRTEDDLFPNEKYTYQHPDYPTELKIKHQFIADEFKKSENIFGLPSEVIDQILALPHEEVVSDISNIILYTIGQTWKSIDDDTIEKNQDSSILHGLAFLTELGSDAGLEAVMEVMRQDDAFSQYHLGDADGMIVSDAIYATGRNHTDVLEAFLKHPGYDRFAKGHVSDALSLIANREPERRQEVIDIYRRYLNFMQENIPRQNGCCGYVAGLVISSLMGIKAEELLPEIKLLHDSRYVNLNICGSYDRVEEGIKTGDNVLRQYKFKGIKYFYQELESAFNHPD